MDSDGTIIISARRRESSQMKSGSLRTKVSGLYLWLASGSKGLNLYTGPTLAERHAAVCS